MQNQEVVLVRLATFRGLICTSGSMLGSCILFVRPTEADSERQHNWRKLKRQRDLGDLLGTLRASFEEERGEDSLLSMVERGWLTVFFLIQVFWPESSSRNSSWSSASRAQGQFSWEEEVN